MTDSGNSTGSSSAGDDEYDSRARSSSISAFLNDPIHGVLTRQQPPLHHHHAAPNLHSSPMFDPMSNFFDPLTTRSSAPNPILNLDMAIWAKSHPQSAEPPSCTGGLGGFSMPPMQLQHLLGGGGATTFTGPAAPGSVSDQALGAVSNSNSNSSNLNTANNSPRNPKKRSRASRRAPTTVLSTDTNNFRAMVQEFTGIPNGPFATSPFQRTRLDLFGSASGAPSYLLRPFAQKMPTPSVPPFISPPPPPPPTLFGALASSPTANTTSNSDLGLMKCNAQNPILDVQSLFQSPNKYLATSSIFPNKLVGEPDHSKLGVLEEFGLGHSAVSTHLLAGLPNVDSSDRNSPNNWGAETTGPNDHGGINIRRSLGGNYSASPSPRGGNGPKMGYLGSAAPPLSEFINSDRGTENNNTGSKGEGMVESWICSSDYN